MSEHFVLLEGDADWSGDPAIVVHWDRTDVASGRLSLPQLVDHNWRQLRDEYLRWIHDCGKSLRPAMRLAPDGPSAWWMTLMAEKSPMKTRTIYTVFRLRAFEILCEMEDAGAVTYVGGNTRVKEVLSSWCSETGRLFQHAPTEAKNTDAPMGRKVSFLPHALRGLAWLLWVWWSRVRRVSKPAAEKRDVRAAIVTYFPNCDPGALTEGRFRSNYWQEAHDLFDRMEDGVDWIWMYAPSDTLAISEAAVCRDRCNEAGGNQRFRLLEEFVTVAVFSRAIRAFLSLVARSGKIMESCGAVKMPGSRLGLNPVIREDWYASVRGIVAAEAAYYHAAFDAMAAALPTPQRGLYVCENQPWEAALVAAWKHRGVDWVIAHQHEAVKPLNLRLFDDPETIDDGGPDSRPAPDILAVGSEDAAKAFQEAGWPADRVRLVESLRFRSGDGVAVDSSDPGYLLLVTGYLAPETRTMLAMTAEADASGALAGYDGIRIKPHPFLPVDDMLAEFGFASVVEVVNEPLDSLWPRTGFAFLANSTAAIFDALSARVSCAVCAPDDDLNLSPALGLEGVTMIGRAETLTIAAQARTIPAAPPEFCYESGLPRWADLLGIDCGEEAVPAGTAVRTGGLR